MMLFHCVHTLLTLHMHYIYVNKARPTAAYLLWIRRRTCSRMSSLSVFMMRHTLVMVQHLRDTKESVVYPSGGVCSRALFGQISKFGEEQRHVRAPVRNQKLSWSHPGNEIWHHTGLAWPGQTHTHEHSLSSQNHCFNVNPQGTRCECYLCFSFYEVLG